MVKITRQELEKAFRDLGHAGSILDVLRRADIGLSECETSAFCEILSSLIKPAESLLDSLTIGYPIEPEKE